MKNFFNFLIKNLQPNKDAKGFFQNGLQFFGYHEQFKNFYFSNLNFKNYQKRFSFKILRI